jgi:hypothetical protein
MLSFPNLRKNRRYLIIIIVTIIFVALQPFVGPWLLYQFLDPVQSQYNSLDGGWARRKAATETQDNTNTE